ncbi:MAG: hypothetical protein EXQ79_10190 [Acidimicrobiia bacterium]|nr:hypothetical protein [Acidimicrobiia bacterium]
MTQPMWWYTVRASGIVAWAVLTASVVWGLWLSAKPARRPRASWVLDLHRFLGPLGLVFIGVHLVGLSFDRFVGFSVPELTIPFASDWEPSAVAWGVVAMYLVLAIEVTSLAMRLLPRRVWHAVHLLSIVAYGLTTAHGFTAGTDAGSVWFLVFGIGSTALVVAMLVVRVVLLLRPLPSRPSSRSRIPIGVTHG